MQAAAGAGDLRGAQALAESIPLRQLRDQALVALVPAWARAGERGRAVALAERIRYPHNWGRAWALLAKAVADSGDIDGALRFAARADDEVSSYPADGTEQVLALLAEVAVATGDHDRAAALADRVADLTRSRNSTGWSKPRPLAEVLAREALAGDLDRLDALLHPPGPAVGAGGTAIRAGPRPSSARSPTARHEPAHWPHSWSCPSRPTPAGSPRRSWFSAAGHLSCRSWSGSCPVQWQ
ncbi:hypothetical protein ABT404_26285 [Streptomyces hyaluromycini]|uniref:Uncharacterized protein n=1 Tax=Streptomyces hyaluromycini TaxID=1377993 RepID=A0ABV1X1P5_9ACTN